MQPPNEAEAVRAWAEALQLGGPAGQAAGLRLGDLRLSLDDKESSQALADWAQTLAKVNVASDFKNPYVELAEIRTLFDRALQRFQGKLDAKRTEEVAVLYRKIAPGGIAEKQLAQAAEAYAQQLQDKNLAGAEEVQAQYRRAAAAYEQAAAVGRDTERPELLWACRPVLASLAKDNALALKMLRQHVDLEKNEARLAESWNALGDLYRAQGLKEEGPQGLLQVHRRSQHAVRVSCPLLFGRRGHRQKGIREGTGHPQAESRRRSGRRRSPRA